jgi:hypothetical protein
MTKLYRSRLRRFSASTCWRPENFEKIPSFALRASRFALQGLKSKNFAGFHKVFLADPDMGREGKRAELAADILKIKGHLTLEGLDKIRQIRDGMNSRRI